MVTIEDTAEVTMWYRSDITTQDVLMLNDSATLSYEILNVENIEMRNLYLVLKVRRVVLS